MIFSSNKSLPIWLLLAVVMHNTWHLKGVYKYHKYERPSDRWDFKVWDYPTSIRMSDPASFASQHLTSVKFALFGKIRRQEQTKEYGFNHTILDTFEPINKEPNHTIATNSNSESNSNKDEDTDSTYIHDKYLHQPFSEKNSPWKIYFHVICGSVPIFTGAANLLDFMRTTRSGSATITHRYMGYLFFVFGLITAIQGTILAPNMKFSHYRTILCTCVALLGVATATCIVFSIQFLRTAIFIRKDNVDTKQQTLRRANIVGHRVWAFRAWLLMEFFILWARVLMGMNFLLTGNKYSFVIGGITSLVTVPFMLEWAVKWHLTRTHEGKKYRLLGPLPWASNDELIRLETPIPEADPKKID